MNGRCMSCHHLISAHDVEKEEEIVYLGCRECGCTRKLHSADIICSRCSKVLYGAVNEMGWKQIYSGGLRVGTKHNYYCSQCVEQVGNRRVENEQS